MKKTLRASVALLTLAAAPALAGAKTASGTNGTLNWTATSRIVGQGSTGTVAAGGLATYFARNTDIMPGTTNKNYSGTVGVLMRYSDGGQFVCSGTLLSDRRSVLTAGHCVSDGYKAQGKGKADGLVSTSVVFLTNAASNADTPYYTFDAGGKIVGNTGTVSIDVANYHVNKGYTGEVIDQNDIAVLRLKDAAPAFAQSYGVYSTKDLTGQQFNVASFGTRSTIGGAQGTTDANGVSLGAGPNRRREGDNRYDFRFGDDVFGGFFDATPNPGRPGSTQFFGKADISYSYLSDFDNGLAAQDASCNLAVDFAGADGLKFCDTGLGLREVSIAGGDSGGGAFIDGKIASVNSYGLSFGAFYGDVKPGIQSSWGEYNGFVPTFIHEQFIAGAIPEPSSWALLLTGFGLLGAAVRRRRSLTVRFA